MAYSRSGDFATVGRDNTARLWNSGGSNPLAHVDGFTDIPSRVVLTHDGTRLIAGDFTHFNDVPASGIMRLNQDGTRDNSFTPGTAADGASIRAVAVRDPAGFSSVVAQAQRVG